MTHEWRKGMVLNYVIDETSSKALNIIKDVFDELKACRKIWHIQASEITSDRKRNAGASTLITRTAVRPTFKNPPFVRSNIKPFCINAGKQNLYFLPDRLLIYDRKGVGSVSYKSLIIEFGSKRFIEADSVPNDAQIVDHNWQYANQSGGPDRRFKNNKQIPVCLYDELYFKSDGGLNEKFQISKPGAGEKVKIILSAIPALYNTSSRLAGRHK